MDACTEPSAKYGKTRQNKPYRKDFKNDMDLVRLHRLFTRKEIIYPLSVYYILSKDSKVSDQK